MHPLSRPALASLITVTWASSSLALPRAPPATGKGALSGGRRTPRSLGTCLVGEARAGSSLREPRTSLQTACQPLGAASPHALQATAALLSCNYTRLTRLLLKTLIA